MNKQAIIRNSIPVTVNAHSGEGQYVDGIYVPADKISYDLSMVPVPISHKELKYFDDENFEENFTVEDRKFYDAFMRVDIKENDVIVVNDKEFEVAKVLDRKDRGFRVYFGKFQK